MPFVEINNWDLRRDRGGDGALTVNYSISRSRWERRNNLGVLVRFFVFEVDKRSDIFVSSGDGLGVIPFPTFNAIDNPTDKDDDFASRLLDKVNDRDFGNDITIPRVFNGAIVRRLLQGGERPEEWQLVTTATLFEDELLRGPDTTEIPLVHTVHNERRITENF